MQHMKMSKLIFWFEITAWYLSIKLVSHPHAKHLGSPDALGKFVFNNKKDLFFFKFIRSRDENKSLSSSF